MMSGMKNVCSERRADCAEYVLDAKGTVYKLVDQVNAAAFAGREARLVDTLSINAGLTAVASGQ